MSKIRLLIIDDCRDFRETMRLAMDSQPDIDVVGEGENGLDALEKAMEVSPNIVLMDIGMPVMGGIEATSRLKERLPDVKVIGLSVHENEEYHRSMMEAGASTYVSKETPLPDLLKAIRDIFLL